MTEKYDRFFQVLELSNGASLAEVRNAYQQLKTLYSADSIAISAISYEFSEDNRRDVLEQIDEAYTKLVEFFENRGKDVAHKVKPTFVADDEFKKYLLNVPLFSGLILKEIREKLGVELKDMAEFTRIRRQYFEDIELEKFSVFPSEVYLRGYVVEYAKYLSLDPVRVAADYLKRYCVWTAAKEKKS